MPPEQRLPLNQPSTLIATFFGSGYAKHAPGTAGSLAASLLIWIYLASAADVSYVNALILPMLALLVVYAAGLWSTRRYTARVGGHDPGSVVIDEVAGMLTALLTSQLLAPWLFVFGPLVISSVSVASGGPMVLAIPELGIASPLQQTLLLLIFFRFFDILKPWPIRRIDRELDNAHGVMLDDVVAGVFAGVAWAVLVLAFAGREAMFG